MRQIRKKRNENVEDDNNDEDIQQTNDVLLQEISKGDKLEKFYNILTKISNFLFKTIRFLFKASGIYFLWICLHYFSAHLYIKFCVPSTLFGFFMSPFMVSTPHCQGLRWIVYNAASVINNMWILIGAWIYSMIWILREKSTDTSSGL